MWLPAPQGTAKVLPVSRERPLPLMAWEAKAPALSLRCGKQKMDVKAIGPQWQHVGQ